MADKFTETKDFDQINKTEDVSLGITVDGFLGYSSESLGPTATRWCGGCAASAASA